jgi:uncharacterized membrane protein
MNETSNATDKSEIISWLKKPNFMFLLGVIIVSGVILLLSPGNPVRVLLGTILVLWMPGWAFYSAVWPYFQSKDHPLIISLPLQLVLSIVMSLLIVMVIWLVYNYLSIPYEHITIGLIGFTLIFAIIPFLFPRSFKK